MKQKGTASDIVKLADRLTARSKELQMINIGTDMCDDYNVTEVNFTSPQADEIKNVFGNFAVAVQGE